jgi:hypothetical protein
MLASLRNLLAGAALVAALVIPATVLAQGIPTLTLSAQAGFFSGKWVYRSFNISANSKDTLAKLALGLNELEITEQKGQVVGKRTGQGVSYDLAGNAFYAAKQGATIRLHGTATISGKTYNYDYFGYVMPAWTGIRTTPDTIIGTVLRSDPANPNNAPVIANFSATREAAK